MASLEEFIAQELSKALDHQERGGFSAPQAERGMAVGGPDNTEIVLTVADVARIAAQAVTLHRASPMPKMTAEEARAKMDELGMRSTPEGRAWAKRVLAESRERQAQDPGAGRRWLEGVMERARRPGEGAPDA